MTLIPNYMGLWVLLPWFWCFSKYHFLSIFCLTQQEEELHSKRKSYTARGRVTQQEEELHSKRKSYTARGRVTQQEEDMWPGETQPILLPESICVYISSFRSVVLRVCLTKVPFLLNFS